MSSIYTVSLCRKTIEFVDIEVEAETEEEANQLALDTATGPQKKYLHWEAGEQSAEPPEVFETYPYAKYW